MAAAIPWGDWSAAGHGIGLLDRASFWLGLLSLAGFLVLLVRALLFNRRYRALGMLAPEDLALLREQVAVVERGTQGEVAVVVLEESDAHPQGAMLAGLLGGIAAATIAAADPSTAHAAILLPALLLGAAAGYLLARALPHFRRRFVTSRRADQMVEEQALQEFSRLGLDRTEGRTGVLILVSLFERAVIVLADEGIHGRVGEDAWLEADRRILEGVRAGSLARGLRDGVEAVGNVLRTHCPRSGPPRNELPDHIIVRRR